MLQPEKGPIISVLMLALAGCTDNESSLTATPPLTIQEVADGIYVHTGRHVAFDSRHNDDIANIGFIVGEECVAVIDTGGSVATGKALKQTIQATTDTPVCYVINSHVHYDHLLGNLPFKQEDVEFIGHANLADAVAASQPFFLEQYATNLGEQADQAIIEPTRGIHETLTLDLGDRSIDISAWPPAHTNNDLTVYDQKTKTLWAADLVFMERIPALDASLKGWLEIMRELEQIPAERVVPGHGPASAPWPEALTAQRHYLTNLLEETRMAIQSGQFLDEAQDNVGQAAMKRWQLADQHHKRNVSRAYSELEWE